MELPQEWKQRIAESEQFGTGKALCYFRSAEQESARAARLAERQLQSREVWIAEGEIVGLSNVPQEVLDRAARDGRVLVFAEDYERDEHFLGHIAQDQVPQIEEPDFQRTYMDPRMLPLEDRNDQHMSRVVPS